MYERPVSSQGTKFLYPLLENYYSDWHQLSFTFEPEAPYGGYYLYEENAFGQVSSQIFAINFSKFYYKDIEKHWPEFVEWFQKIWMHEFLHLVGLSEEGLEKVKKLGYPTA